jgi:two-component system, chemotaxis family, CheB/CheR fusion protein
MTARNTLVNTYEKIFNNMLDGFALFRLIIDDEGLPADYEYVYFNHAYEQMTGMKASFLEGHTAIEIFGYIDPAALRKYGEVAISGNPQHYERFIENSQKYYKYNVFSPEKDYFAVIISDITRQKKNELNLRASEEKFRELAENIQEIYWLWAGDKLLYVSPAYEKIWGCPVRALYENPDSFTDHIHPDDKESFLLKYRNFEISGHFDEEYRILRPDGQIRWIWARYFPVMNEKGVMYRYAGVAQDITARKEAERELIIARDKARESDKLKSAFLANMSHEIRTPMNGILGLAQFLKDASLDQTERDSYIDIINESGKLLMNIINDIIDIAKIESGQINLSLSDCHVDEILGNLLTLYKARAGGDGKAALEISFEKKAQHDLIILTDGFRLQQVLVNLIGNAYKYTERGFIRFGYEIRGEEIEFYVSDSGIGIPEEKHQHIFERFTQVDYSSTRLYGGTGLGLAICKGLLELLGGSIWLKSAPGAGSEFRFKIPYRKSEHSASHTRSAEPEAAPVFDWKEHTALVAEDDDINYKVLEIFLRKTGISLVRVKNGNDAVEYFSSSKSAALVLMDIQLPGMDGYTATRKIKKMLPDMPVIIQTAHALVEERKRCMEAGADDFITKPVEAPALLKAMAAFLEK